MMKSFSIGDKEIRLPIVQGGMGIGVSLSGLASAVANEGGIGVISCAGLGLVYKLASGEFINNNNQALRDELGKARALSQGVIGVNIMVVLSNFVDLVRTAIDEQVDVIFAGAGLPLDMPSYLTPGSKTRLVPIVSSARAAKVICEKWRTNYNYLPDAIVVEGPKAGGHLGFKRDQIEDKGHSLEHLIPEVVAIAAQYSTEKQIPVIAAGGITTGADILRFIELGAAGVQLGSLFVPTHECDAALAFKQVFIDSAQKDILIIQSPVGMPGRAFDGEFIRSVNRGEQTPKGCPYHCIRTCDYKNSPYCIAQALYNAARGNLDRGYVFAGANAYLTDHISSVKEVVDKLKDEFQIASLSA